jgi:hypothetical protein
MARRVRHVDSTLFDRNTTIAVLMCGHPAPFNHPQISELGQVVD